MKKILSTLIVGWLCVATSARSDPAANLARHLEPYLAALGGKSDHFTLHAQATFDVKKKPQQAEFTFALVDKQAFGLSITHPQYPLIFTRDANRTTLALPAKGVVFVGEGPVSGGDTLDPGEALQHLISDGSAASTYAVMLSKATAPAAALLATVGGFKSTDGGDTWSGSLLGAGTVAFDKSDAATVTTEELKATITLTTDADLPAIPVGLRTVKLDRVEMERLFARGVRRTLEVVAPSPLLTEPLQVNRRLPHGELTWDHGQRLCVLWGSPTEIGEAHGTLLKTQARRCADSALYMVGIGATVLKGTWFLDDLRDAYRRLEPHIPADHKAETDALADAAGIPREEGRLANVFPELFHCSGFALFGKATVDGKLYHGRVLDYMTMVGLQDAATTFVISPNGKIPFANVGYAGFVGSVSGMNAKQISLGEMGGRGEGQWDGVPMATLMRRGLEECSTLDEVKHLWTSNPRTCAYYYVFSDGKIPDAVGVSATPEKVEFLKPGEAHPLLGEGIPDAIVCSAGSRLIELRRRVMAGYGRFDVASSEGLMTKPVTMGSNLHDVLFVPQDGVFYVANADHAHPAYERPYTRYDLREVLRSIPKGTESAALPR